MKTLLYLAFLACFTYSTNINAQSTDTTITFKVKGITCGTDLKMIEESVKDLNGISDFVVAKKGATSNLAISFDPTLVEEKEIRLAIQSTASCKAPDERPYKVK